MKIPAAIQAGDSVTWLDDPWVDPATGKRYDSGSYTLTYTLAGPIAAPVNIAATASAPGWSTTLDTTTSAALVAGKYWWQAVLTATGERITVGQGELQVTVNLASQGANYDGRSVAEKALADAETALANFKASGGLVKSYSIGQRTMTFQDTAGILTVISYWKARVTAEQNAKLIAQGLGNPRKLYTRFR